MRHWRVVKHLLLVLAAWPLAAQNLSVGVRAGIPLTDAFKAARAGNFNLTSERSRYVLGPTFEVRLPLGLGIHVDALYRNISVTGDASTGTAASNTFGFWQFPVMGKLRLGVGPVRPYVNAGPSFTKLTGIGSAASCVINLGANSCAGRVLKSTGTGFAMGGGVELKLPIIRVSPEVRYTRLGTFFDGGAAPGSLSGHQNQLDLLLGVTF
jgi:opacity protein-like surface antigen